MEKQFCFDRFINSCLLFTNYVVWAHASAAPNTTRKQVNSNGYIRWYFVGIAQIRRNSDEKGRRYAFVGKKVRRKFVTSSDENPRETDGYISNGQLTIPFVVIYFIGNLSHISDRSDHRKNNSDEIYLSDISDETRLSRTTIWSELYDKFSTKYVVELFWRTCFRRFFLFIIIFL